MITINESEPNLFLLTTVNSPENLNSNWFQWQFWKQENAITGTSTGRNTTYFFRQHSREFVLRQYFRGGLFAKFNKDNYLFRSIERTRAYQELSLLEKLQQLGLPAPIPIAGLVQRAGAFYKARLIIEKIHDADDAFHCLLERPLSKDEWIAIGRTIRRFHNHQVYHSDLNIHNVMLDKSGKVWLIDFDKGAIRESSSEWKAHNLTRLKRSLNKELHRHPKFCWQESDWENLLTGYHQNNSHSNAKK